MMADLVRWLVEPGVPVVLVAARPAPQRHTTHAPAVLGRSDLLGVNEAHGGRCRSFAQVVGLCRSHEVGIGR